MAISSTALILIVVLIVLAVGVAPSWPHSKRWGYAPSGTLEVRNGAAVSHSAIAVKPPISAAPPGGRLRT